MLPANLTNTNKHLMKGNKLCNDVVPYNINENL